jgi:hypothetical protein
VRAPTHVALLPWALIHVVLGSHKEPPALQAYWVHEVTGCMGHSDSNLKFRPKFTYKSDRQ